MKTLRNEAGQTLVLTALCMTCLTGFLALSIDVGMLFHTRRNLQIVADSAAIAAAEDYYYNGGTATSPVPHAQSAGQAAATANGVTNGTNGTVSINCAPTSGPNVGTGGCNGYFEAVVTQTQATTFLGVFGGLFHNNAFKTLNVSARGVAGTPSDSNACIWIMAPSGSDTIHMQGSGTITAPGCGVYVNSSDSAAAKFTGNPTYTGPSFAVVGGESGHTTNINGYAGGVAPTSPPIPTSLTGPVPPGACTTSTSLTNITTANMATVSGSAVNNVICFTNTTTPVTLNNGVNLAGAAKGVTYVFEDGVIMPTGATVNMGTATASPSGCTTNCTFSNTSGATMDLYGGTLNQNSGQSQLNVYAPTAGTYNSIAIMQPTSNTTTPLQVQFGSNNEYLDGIIFAPGVQVYLQDNGGGVTASGVVCNTMFLKSSSLTIPGYSVANAATTPFRLITLVE